jgi:lactoylglutathione lyase
MTAQFGYVLLYVADVDKAVAFYSAALGITVRFQQGTYVEMETGGTALGFVTREFAQTHFKDKLPPPGQGASEIGFVVPLKDVDATYQKALQSGASAVLEPENKPWGQRISYVRDPDGHLIEICSPVSG